METAISLFVSHVIQKVRLHFVETAISLSVSHVIQKVRLHFVETAISLSVSHVNCISVRRFPKVLKYQG